MIIDITKLKPMKKSNQRNELYSRFLSCLGKLELISFPFEDFNEKTIQACLDGLAVKTQKVKGVKVEDFI